MSSDGREGTTPVEPGMRVLARDVSGRDHERIAVTGVVDGRDFPVVWICKPEDYEIVVAGVVASPDSPRDLREHAWPWPSEDVRPA